MYYQTFQNYITPTQCSRPVYVENQCSRPVYVENQCPRPVYCQPSYCVPTYVDSIVPSVPESQFKYTWTPSQVYHLRWHIP